MTSAAQSATGEGRPQKFNATGLGKDLGTWGRLFWRYPSPRIIGAALLASIIARIFVGGWSLMDIVAGGVVIALQPFTEWLLHVIVLHFKPRPVGRVTVDLYIAKKHRAHHVDPSDIGLTFVQIPALLALIVVYFVAVAAGYRDWHLALTACVSGYSMLLIYEWMHYLIHSTYVPKSRMYRTIYRAHRLHHFKNEHYWFGVTNPIGDMVLRTYPDKTKVTTSETARTLGVG